MAQPHRDDNTRLGDISYQLSELVKVFKRLLGDDLTVDPDYFNDKFKKNNGN